MIHFQDKQIEAMPFAKLGLEFFKRNNKQSLDWWVENYKELASIPPIFWNPDKKEWVFKNPRPEELSEYLKKCQKR